MSSRSGIMSSALSACQAAGGLDTFRALEQNLSVHSIPVRDGTSTRAPPGRLHTSDRPEEQLCHSPVLTQKVGVGSRWALSGHSKEKSGEVDTALLG